MTFEVSKKTLVIVGSALAVILLGTAICAFTRGETEQVVHDKNAGTNTAVDAADTPDEKSAVSAGTNDEPKATHQTAPPKPKPASYSTRVEGYSAILSRDGKVIQTVTLEGLERTGAEHMVEIGAIDGPFIIDEDINFDGYMDLSAAVSYGYGGRSQYHNYYMFNPKTERFERDPLLTEIVNPIFYPERKTITSAEISGVHEYETSYVFNGKEYVKGETKVNCNNEDVCGDEL